MTCPFRLWQIFYVLAVLCSVSLGRLSAQQREAVSIGEVLSSFYQDSLYRQIEATEAWATEQSWRGSTLREWEIRTETDEFDWDQQELTFRVSPRRRGENEYRSSRQRIRSQSLNTSKQQRQALVLKDRYQLLVKLYLLQKQQASKQQQKQMLEEKIRLLALRFGDQSLDPVDLAKAETDLFELEGELESILAQYAIHQQHLQSWLKRSDSVSIQLDEMISIEEIETSLQTLASFEAYQMPAILVAAYEVEDRYLEWQLERLQNNRWLNFAQARVKGDDMGFRQPQFSIGLAFNLPLVKENKSQEAINELRWRIAQSEQDLIIAEHESQELRTRGNLLSLIERWRNSQVRISKGLTQRTLDRIRQQEEQDALTLLRLEEQLLKQRQLLSKIEQQVYEAYLLWLEHAGHLSANSPRNFFSENMEVLQE